MWRKRHMRRRLLAWQRFVRDPPGARNKLFFLSDPDVPRPRAWIGTQARRSPKASHAGGLDNGQPRKEHPKGKEQAAYGESKASG